MSLPINTNILVCQVAFLLGIFYESLCILSLRKERKSLILFVVVVVLSIFKSLVPGGREYQYDLHRHLWYMGVVYSILLFLFFTESLLPSLSEFDIILQTICVWLITIFGSTISIVNQFTPYINIIGLVILIYIFKPIRANKFIEVGLYAWFIILTTVIIIIQCQWFFSYPFYQTLSFQGIFTMFTSGMTGFILIRNFTILYELLPIPGKHQSMEERWKQLREYVHLIRHKFDDKQLSPFPAIIFTVGVMFFVLANEYYRVLPQSTVVFLLLVVGQYTKGVQKFYLLPK